MKNKDKYRNDTFMVSFSGGRTSALLTRIMLDNHDPGQLVICFANTGKEHENTLKFVHDCEVNWGIKINWLELCSENGFKIVNYETASRNGEPYKELILKRKFVPNAVTRYCTTELKIKPMKRFMKSLGHKFWYNVVGIRADEPSRYHRLDKSCQKEPYETTAPLYQMGITKANVLKYWSEQPWNLEIPEYLGNCDMCFLKSRVKLKRIIKEEPDRVKWWHEMEELTGASFRNNLPYKKLVQMVESAPELFDSDFEIECFCTID